jgi:hypothetical protein
VPALVRHLGPEDPAILGALRADDEAERLEAVDEPCHAALAEEHGPRQLAHPQTVLLRALEVEQDLVLGERQPVGCLELAVELADELGVRADESRPGRELERGELLEGDGVHGRIVASASFRVLEARRAA